METDMDIARSLNGYFFQLLAFIFPPGTEAKATVIGLGSEPSSIRPLIGDEVSFFTPQAYLKFRLEDGKEFYGMVDGSAYYEHKEGDTVRISHRMSRFFPGVVKVIVL